MIQDTTGKLGYLFLNETIFNNELFKKSLFDLEHVNTVIIFKVQELAPHK